MKTNHHQFQVRGQDQGTSRSVHVDTDFAVCYLLCHICLHIRSHFQNYETVGIGEPMGIRVLSGRSLFRSLSSNTSAVQ
ncbi:hypothetical protein Hanom_Chr13g01189821 [Helianthus anomalus]